MFNFYAWQGDLILKSEKEREEISIKIPYTLALPMMAGAYGSYRHTPYSFSRVWLITSILSGLYYGIPNAIRIYRENKSVFQQKSIFGKLIDTIYYSLGVPSLHIINTVISPVTVPLFASVSVAIPLLTGKRQYNKEEKEN